MHRIVLFTIGAALVMAPGLAEADDLVLRGRFGCQVGSLDAAPKMEAIMSGTDLGDAQRR